MLRSERQNTLPTHNFETPNLGHLLISTNKSEAKHWHSSRNVCTHIWSITSSDQAWGFFTQAVLHHQHTHKNKKIAEESSPRDPSLKPGKYLWAANEEAEDGRSQKFREGTGRSPKRAHGYRNNSDFPSDSTLATKSPVGGLMDVCIDWVGRARAFKATRIEFWDGICRFLLPATWKQTELTGWKA